MATYEADSDHIEVTVQDGVATLIIDRPDRMNAYTPEMAGDIIQAIETLEKTDSVRAAVLTGAGSDAFCAGFDIQAYIDMSDGDNVTEGAMVASTRKTQRVVKTLRSVQLPIVAAVNGYALGGGMDIALACDIRVAHEAAEFSQAYVNVGLVPDAGAYLLPRLIGEARAKRLIATGEHVSARDAMEMGFVAEVVEGGSTGTVEAARRLASDIADGPTVAVGIAKQLVNESFDVSLETALDHAIEGERVCFGTEDHHEAIDAFKEDRAPSFTGS